jgi:photosystem II stability/assembly factor-like uncharacterized protein
MSEIALIAGSEEGLYTLHSRDGGATWETRTAIPDIDVAEVAAANGTIYVGTRGQGILKSDDLQSWKPVEVPGALQKVRSFWIDGDRFLVGNEARPDPVGVYEWEDGETWRPLGDLSTCSAAAEWTYPVASVGVHVRFVSSDPHQPDRLYAAIQVGGVAISPDGGRSWYDRRNLDLDCHMVLGDPRRPGVVYAGTGGGGLYRSTDYGDSWEGISDPCGPFVVQFALDPATPDRIYLGTARGSVRSWETDPNGAHGEIWRTDDAGATWRKLTGGLPDQLKARPGTVHVDREDPDNVFVACDLPRGGPDAGIFYSGDAGESWRKLTDVQKVVSVCAVHR